MIRFFQGDLFAADVDALVNPVNCVGVMGAGLAAEFKRRFPEIFAPYFEACETLKLTPGNPIITPTDRDAPAWIVQFPTKGHWRNKSHLSEIRPALAHLPGLMIDNGVRSIAIPALGCGLGGLDWRDFKPAIVEALDIDALRGCDIRVYEPTGAQGHG